LCQVHGSQCMGDAAVSSTPRHVSASTPLADRPRRRNPRPYGCFCTLSDPRNRRILHKTAFAEVSFRKYSNDPDTLNEVLKVGARLFSSGLAKDTSTLVSCLLWCAGVWQEELLRNDTSGEQQPPTQDHTTTSLLRLYADSPLDLTSPPPTWVAVRHALCSQDSPFELTSPPPTWVTPRHALVSQLARLTPWGGRLRRGAPCAGTWSIHRASDSTMCAVATCNHKLNRTLGSIKCPRCLFRKWIGHYHQDWHELSRKDNYGSLMCDRC
jgi:hypothetical protein